MFAIHSQQDEEADEPPPPQFMEEAADDIPPPKFMVPKPKAMPKRIPTPSVTRALSEASVGVISSHWIDCHRMLYTLRTVLCILGGVVLPPVFMVHT